MGLALSPRENAQLHLGADQNLHRAENTTAAGRQVGQIPVSGQHLPLHRKMTAKLNVNTFMLALILHCEFGLRARRQTVLRITRTIGQKPVKRQHCPFLGRKGLAKSRANCAHRAGRLRDATGLPAWVPLSTYRPHPTYLVPREWAPGSESPRQWSLRTGCRRPFPAPGTPQSNFRNTFPL
jgi:hypothetical protein